jgi:hypothetical protein
MEIDESFQYRKMKFNRRMLRLFYHASSLFPVLLVTPALSQADPQIAQTTSTIRRFIGSVAVRRAGATELQRLVKGDVGIPVEPGAEIQLGPDASLTLKCASGQVKNFKGPRTVKVNTECPSGEPVASRALAVSGATPLAAPEPEPVRGLW